MAGIIVNEWALRYYKPLTEETIYVIMDELEAGIAGTKRIRVFSSVSETYALASRFKNILYKYPYFKKKHLRILNAIIDRCGEAYYEKDVSKLYISKTVIEDWAHSFQIPDDRIHYYIDPLLRFGILSRQSDKSKYVYRVNDHFFKLMGPIAQYLVKPVDTRRFAEMMAIASGVSSIYVVATSAKIPWFLKLSMIYTLTGLDPKTLRVRELLELARINAVDNYFVREKGAPVEWWRSIRTEAFEFMADNRVVEQAVPHGYKLSTLWVKVHEEGVRRYVRRWRERHRKRFNRF